MSKTHGYQLPSGEAYTEDLSCALVFYPDKDEYRRALLGALTYFETWLAWELDDSKRGKDAARAWAFANVCTLECWNMACIDELLATMEAVRALLENRKDCCDDNVSYGTQDEVVTEIVPGEGDPPDEYGETAIETWDDWAEHVCYNAHLYVDNLINQGNQIGGAVEQNSLFLGLIAAALTLLSFSGVGLPVAYLLASFVVTGLVLAATSATFANTEDDFEDARDDIVCALLQGGDLAGVIEDAIETAPWELFYQHNDYDSASAIIHEGGIEGDYLPSETKDDCADCPTIYDYTPEWFFTEDKEDWTANGGWLSNCEGCITQSQTNQEMHIGAAALRLSVGLGSTGSVSIGRMDWVWLRTTTLAFTMKIYHNEGTFTRTFTGGTPYDCDVYEDVFDPPLVLDGGSDRIEFNGWVPGNRQCVGYVKLGFDAA